VSHEQQVVAKQFLSLMFNQIKNENLSKPEECSTKLGETSSKRSRFADLQDTETDQDPTSFEAEMQRYFMARIVMSEETGI